ncbi:uncharacterized protein LOC143290477 [Babylonia areolata]|uniref:uncharacterized protein LOC143290477 n=1 Tax=Babylonia areolata TaxID=304850 RepID=UPI003FD609B1
MHVEILRKLVVTFCCFGVMNVSGVCGLNVSTKNGTVLSTTASDSDSPTKSVTLVFNSRSGNETLNENQTSTDCPLTSAQHPQTLTTVNVLSNNSRTITNSITSTTTNSSLPDTEDHSDNDEEEEEGTLQDSEELSAQPSVSQEDYKDIMEVLDVVLIVTEGISVAVTATSAGVYMLPNMRCSTAVYLAALNGADTLCGVLVACRSVWKHVGGLHATRTAAFNYLTLAGTGYVSLASRRCVYCLSVIVSLERFFVITFPLRARHFKIIRFPKVTVTILAFVIFSFHVYYLLKYHVVKSTTTGGYRLSYTESYREDIHTFDHVSNSGKFLFAYIPLCLGLGMSVALLLALRRHAAARASLQEAGGERRLKQMRDTERQMARTIWMSTFLFTVLSLPANTAHLVSTYHPTFGYLKLDHCLYRLITRFSYLAIVLSRYTNFFSYLCLSTAFRRNLVGGILPRKIATRFLDSRTKSRAEMTPSDGRSTDISIVSYPQQNRN